jgi:hypothetical protein
MEATQLTLELFPAPPATPDNLTSPWCEAPADLLTQAWQRIRAFASGNQRIRVPAGGDESFEVHAYPFGWAVISTINGNCGYMASCMAKKTLTRLLRSFLKLSPDPRAFITHPIEQ